MVDTADAKALLRYWRLVELMTAGEMPRPKGRDRRRIRSLSVGDALPWPPGPAELPAPDPGKVCRFRVFGGSFDLSAVHRALLERFGDDGLQPEGRRHPVRSALYTVELDENGHVVAGSADLSMCAWSIGRALESSSDELAGFEDERRALVEQLDRLSDPTTPRPTGAERPAGSTWRDRAIRKVDEAARGALGEGASGIGEVLGASTGAAITPFVSAAGGGIVGRVVSTFVSRLLTPALRDPAAEATDAGRVPKLDVVELTRLTETLVGALQVESVDALGLQVQAVQVDPRHPEASRWFLNGVFAAELGRVEREMRRGCGPALAGYLGGALPEVVAARRDVVTDPSVVREALEPRRLPAARWPAPTGRPLVRSQQFGANEIRRRLGPGGGLLGVNGPPGTGKTTLLRDVVADVVTERARRLAELSHPRDAFGRDHVVLVRDGTIPVSVDEPRSSITGFEIVLGTGTKRAGDNVVKEIPALDAVDLDDHRPADHFAELASRILGRESWSLVAAPLGRSKLRSDFAHAFWDGDHGMRRRLIEAEGSTRAASWATAVADFRAALAEVDRMVEERQKVAEAIATLPDLRATAARASDRRRELADEAVELAAHLDAIRYTRDACRRASRDAEEALTLAPRPGAWSWLWYGWRRWRARWTAWEQRYRERDVALDRARVVDDEYTRLDRLGAAVEQQRDDAVRSAAAAEAARDEAVTLAAEARHRWGRAVDASDEHDAPWADHELTWARTEVFLSAVRLHHAFVLGAAGPLRRSLSVVVDQLRGKPVQADDDAMLAAWRAFFLVVPVVSTTFASLPAVFRGLGRESIGWLLVDEAGQAAPQQLVGALWRSRRAVVVGDPLQLEPVLPVPRTVMTALGRCAGVPDIATRTTSAQEMADAATVIGAYLPAGPGDEPRWVGTPLRVHRRCDRPIFDIFSTMAYGPGFLVYGTTARGTFPRADEWVHVDTHHETAKWSSEIQQALEDLLRRIWRAQGGGLENVSVLSPFAETVRCIRRLPVAKHLDENSVGTVHTMQGAEADIVVLVLPTGTTEHRARDWLTASPHLLNVAVSRARRRLYVVGDRSLWAGLEYVDVIARALPYRRADA